MRAHSVLRFMFCLALAVIATVLAFGCSGCKERPDTAQAAVSATPGMAGGLTTNVMNDGKLTFSQLVSDYRTVVIPDCLGTRAFRKFRYAGSADGAARVYMLSEELAQRRFLRWEWESLFTEPPAAEKTPAPSPIRPKITGEMVQQIAEAQIDRDTRQMAYTNEVGLVQMIQELRGEGISGKSSEATWIPGTPREMTFASKQDEMQWLAYNSTESRAQRKEDRRIGEAVQRYQGRQ